jgi:hypothetical protein
MKSQHIIWQHVSLRVYMNWWNGSSVAEATLLTDNGGHWDIILLKSHFDFTKNSRTLHRMRNWVDRGQKAPLPKPLWGGCTPGPLVTLCPTLSDFQIYRQIRFLRFSSFGYLIFGSPEWPNNRIYGTEYTEPNIRNWIYGTKYLVIQNLAIRMNVDEARSNHPKNRSKILSLMNQNRAFFGRFSSTIGITRKIVIKKNVCRVMGWGRESHSQHDITLEGAHVCMWCRCDANQSKTMIVRGTDITRADIGLHVLIWCVYYNDVIVFACWRASC